MLATMTLPLSLRLLVSNVSCSVLATLFCSVLFCSSHSVLFCSSHSVLFCSSHSVLFCSSHSVLFLCWSDLDWSDLSSWFVSLLNRTSWSSCSGCNRNGQEEEETSFLWNQSIDPEEATDSIATEVESYDWWVHHSGWTTSRGTDCHTRKTTEQLQGVRGSTSWKCGS